MGDACVEDFGSFRNEAVTLVEGYRMGLCVQDDLVEAKIARRTHQLCQQTASHAARSPERHHRHSADMAIGQQPAGAYNLAVRAFGHYMHTVGIAIVPFQLGRDVLLMDEHCFAYAPQRCSITFPMGSPDAKRIGHAANYSAWGYALC